MLARKLSRPGLEAARAVIRTGGFQVFYHACGKPELSEDGNPDNYIRAHHRVQEHEGCYNNIEEGCHKAFVYNNISIPGFPSDVAGFGILLKSQISYEIVKRRIKDWTCLWGVIHKERKFKRQKSVDAPLKLQEALTVNQDGDAAFLRIVLRLRHMIKDGAGRGGAQQPTLTLVGSEQVISAVVNHLLREPDDYYPMVQAILTQDRYPKINAEILSGIEPGNRLMLLSSQKVQELARANSVYAQVDDRRMTETLFEACKI